MDNSSSQNSNNNAAAKSASWRDYFDLCKPKVVALLLLTSVVGVVLASPPGEISLFVLFFSTIGIGLGAAAGAERKHLGRGGRGRRTVPDSRSGWQIHSSI